MKKPQGSRRKIKSTRDMAYVALFVAINAVCAWITVPSVIPFTLQTFGIFFTLNVLGGKKGGIAVCVYVLLGIMGAPVFSGFKGGISAIMSATGGYIIAFVVAAAVYVAITAISEKPVFRIVSCFVGLIVCYVFGTLWFVYVFGGGEGSFVSALTICVLPFVVPDAIKTALAVLVSKRFINIVNKGTEKQKTDSQI